MGDVPQQKRAWNPAQMFDVTPAQKKAMEERKKLRMTLKAEYIKRKTDSLSHSSGQGGYIFDPAIQRFNSARAKGYDHFKVTPKTTFALFISFLLPVGVLSYLVNRQRTDLDRKCRNGEIPYKDRQWVFLK